MDSNFGKEIMCYLYVSLVIGLQGLQNVIVWKMVFGQEISFFVFYRVMYNDKYRS